MVDENEELYVAARVLEASAKSRDDSRSAAVHARAAEMAKNGQKVDEFLEKLEAETSEDETGTGARRAVERLRLALEEIEEGGRARIVEDVDDTVVARLRSEYD